MKNRTKKGQGLTHLYLALEDTTICVLGSNLTGDFEYYKGYMNKRGVEVVEKKIKKIEKVKKKDTRTKREDLYIIYLERFHKPIKLLRHQFFDALFKK